MLSSRIWLASVVAVVGLTSAAIGQCYNLPIPQAPDMRGPGYYYYNCQGQLYGPVHNVYPHFEPFQGHLPGPKYRWVKERSRQPWVRQPWGREGWGRDPWAQEYAGPDSAMQAYQPYGMMPGYMGVQQPNPGFQQPPHPGGYPGLWSNPFVRSPRDFFMMGHDDDDSPYRYGGGSSSVAPITTNRLP